MKKFKLWQSIKQVFQKFDNFGHQVVLNFNRNGNTYTTAVGGLLSICINGFIFYFLYLKCSNML